MTPRRVTIIGASGFIGRYAVRQLAGQGAVICACSRHAREAGYLRPMGDVGQVAAFDLDINDERGLAAVVAGADAVVNAAGILYERGRQRFDLLHHQRPGALARLAKAAGVRQFVHISALAAEREGPSAYARSKAAGEEAVRAAFPDAVILRPSLVFGPEDAFFNRFAAMARYVPALPLVGGGHTKFQPVYVGDVAAAIAAALDRDDTAGRTFELAGQAVFELRQLFALMLHTIRRKRLLISVPFGLAGVMAAFLERLPNPLLTRDQVRMLRRDSVATPGAPGLGELGITAAALELILPSYLDRYRRGGRTISTVSPA
ncbi:MAG TPA: complex I NDUFA9 subunit family protein [Stellaceae bacterium]|nr:complex I NDUFA9 subunit family protein [Stellaceae bacterium]